MTTPIKAGKVSSDERQKYAQATVVEGSALAFPEELESHIRSLDLVPKWVAKVKLAANGGRHPSGWIPYEMSEDQKAEIKKGGGYGVGVVNGAFLERGDMVLAVRPIEAHQAAAKALQEKTKRQDQSMDDLVDAVGNKMIDRGRKPSA